MADEKIRDLPALATPALNILIEVEDPSEPTESLKSKKATLQQIVDLVPAGGAFRGALVSKNNAQSVPDNTNAAVSWETEEYDTDSIHDNATNNSRLTVPTGVTRVILRANIKWAANATGRRNTVILKNGLSFAGAPAVEQQAPTGPASVGQNLVSAPVLVTATDFFEVSVVQTSGGNLNINLGTESWFSMEVIE